MYAGHFVIALAINAARPTLPALPVLLGVGLLDILYGLFVVTGVSQAVPNLASGPYLFFDLTFIDWDHSFLMALVWSLAWAGVFWKRPGLALAAGCAVLSHFVADLPMHNMDLALYPYATDHWGMGLWGRLGTAAWVLEGAFCVVVAGYAWRRQARRGVSLYWPLLLLALLFASMSPWTSPMKFIAGAGVPAAQLLHGVLVAFGFLLPALALAALVGRAELRATESALAVAGRA